MNRTLKLLSATSALVAMSAAAHADTVSTNNTAPLFTSTTTTGFQISTGVTVSSSVGAAINISDSSATKNQILVSAGATVSSSHATSATIEALNQYAVTPGAATINVSGTVNQYGASGKAIDLTQMGSVASVINVASTGSISGSITSAGGDDILRNAGTIRGNVNLGAGTNYVSQTAGSINGTLTTTGGNDVVDVYGGSITGAIALGAGGDTLTISGTGAVNSTVDGEGGTNALNFSGTNFTTKGAFTNFANTALVNNATVNFDHAVAGTATVNVGAGSTANVNANQSWQALTLNGTMNVAAAAKVDVNSLAAVGLNSKVNIHVSDSTHFGIIDTATGNVSDLKNTSLSIVFDRTAGYVSNGTVMSGVLQGANATVDPMNLLTKNIGVYRLSMVSNSNNYDLVVNRVSTSTLVSSESGKAVAHNLDVLGNAAKGDLLTLQGVIGNATTTQQVNDILESTTPATDTGSVLTAVNVGVQTGNNVSNRLASLRSAGVSTGDGSYSNHMWVQGFGAFGDQDDKDGNRGYDANSAGASFGVDTDTLVNGTTVGAAFSYAHSTVDSNAANNASTDIDSYIATLYGSRAYDQGYFLNGQASVGWNANETERQVIGFAGKTKGEYDSMQYSLKGEVGRDIAIPAMGALMLTPTAGLQYTYANPDEYTETGPAALNVDGEGFSALDASIGGALSWNCPLSSGGYIKPEFRAAYIYRMGDAQAETTSRFVAGGAAFNTNGVEADRSALALGAGLTLASGGGADLMVDYDADLRDSYTGHTGQVKVRWAF